MQNLILQPSEDHHFHSTIKTGRPLSELKSLLSESDHEELNEIYGDDPIQIWGITPGKNDANVVKWKRIQEGDIACFVKKRRIIYWGAVSFKTRNEELAEYLWGRDDKDQTWEYMYFLRDGEFDGPQMDDINPLLDYDPEFSPRGVMVLSEGKAGPALEVIGDFEAILGEEIQAELPTPSEDREQIKKRASKAHSKEDLEKILRQYEQEMRNAPPKRKRTVAHAISRNRKLAGLVKERAEYRCEVCGSDGFQKKDGHQYAEVHHLEELGAGGLDAPSNMLCVCPTCHRRIHFGASSFEYSNGQWTFAYIQ